MFDLILENYRKATESTMKLQQDVLRNWAMQWPQMFGAQSLGFRSGWSGFGIRHAGSCLARTVERGTEKMGRDDHRYAEQAPRVA